MNIAEIAKRQVNGCAKPDAEIDEEALMHNVESMKRLTDPSLRIAYDYAMRLFVVSVKSLQQRKAEVRADTVCDEIDRIAAQTFTGWERDGEKYTHAYQSPAEAIRAKDYLASCGIKIHLKEGITDFTESLSISAEQHSILTLLFEGREAEIHVRR